MIADLRSVLCWLALCLVLLVALQRGCNARAERFRQWRKENQEYRREHREERFQRWRQRPRVRVNEPSELAGQQRLERGADWV
jgi:hypothetical protein